MEHHYLITEAIPEIEAMGDQRLPIGTDFEGNIYFRQEAVSYTHLTLPTNREV